MPTGGKAGEGYVDIKPRLDPRFGSTLTRQVQPALQSLGSRLSTAGRSMQNFGRQATTFLTLPLVGLGVAAFKASRDFGQAMANVNSIMKVSSAELKAYGDRILNLTERLPQDATTLADGLYNIASSGFAGNQAMRVLTESAEAASAGLTTTEVAARAITASLNAYGMSAKDAAGVSDILFRGVDKGVMTFEELASSMGDYVNMAAQLEVPLQDVVAAQAAMTLSGISAFESATSLNNLLRSMLKPSEAMSAALSDLGFETGQAAIENLGLQGVISALSDHVGDNKQRWVELFPEIRAARGAMALAANDGENLNRVMGDMEDRAGATGAALDRQAKGPAFKWQLAMNRLRRSLIQLGNTLIPILIDDIVPAIQKAADWFSKLPDSTKAWIVKFGLAAAALGPVASVLGTVVRLSGWLIRNAARVVFPTPPVPVPGRGGGAPIPVPGGAGGLAAGARALVGYGAVLLPIITGVRNFAAGQEAAKTQAEGFAESLIQGRMTMGEVRSELERLQGSAGDLMSNSWFNPPWQLAYADVLKRVTGAVDRERNGLRRLGVELNDSEKAAIETYKAQRNFYGILNVLRGATTRAFTGIENVGSAHRRAAEQAADQEHKVKALQETLARLRPPPPIKITADTSSAFASVEAFRRYVAGIQARITLNLGGSAGPDAATAADVEAQHGFAGRVYRPTLFKVGEGGPEDVLIQPAGRGRRGGGGLAGVSAGDLSEAFAGALAGLPIRGTLHTEFGRAELHGVIDEHIAADNDRQLARTRMSRAGG